MGLLERVGMKAELRRLSPFFRSDEHFLETDVCELVRVVFHDDGRSSPLRGRVVVTFTSHALYIRPLDARIDVVRIPFEQVTGAAGGPGMTQINTLKASWLIRDIGDPMGGGDKYVILEEALRRLENHSEVVDVPGGKVKAVNRPFDEGDSGQWMLVADEGLDLSSPAVVEALERALAPAIARHGPLTA